MWPCRKWIESPDFQSRGCIERKDSSFGSRDKHHAIDYEWRALNRSALAIAKLVRLKTPSNF